MACVTESTYPTTLARGVLTALPFNIFPAFQSDGFGCDGFWVDDFQFISSVVVPAFSTVTYSVRHGATVFREDTVVNNSPNPTFAAISGIIAVSPNGKQFDFNDSGGNPVSKAVDGFWQDGFTLLVSTQSIPPGSPPATIEIDQHSISAGMVPASTFDGPNPPDPPSNGNIVDDVPPDDGATITWQDDSSDELGFKIERDDGQLFFVSANITTYYDPTGRGHSYSISAFRGDGTPDSGTSEELFIQGSGPPQITYVGLLLLAIETFSEFSFMADIITIVGNINIDIATLAEIVYLVDPSGVYTLVEGQTHDILYERGGVITTQELKIPDPFFITGYAGD